MTPVGNQYGQALYALAVEEGLCEPILQQLEALRESFAEAPEYLHLLSAPTLSKAERCQILQDAFGGKLEAYLLNFLKLLTEKGHIRHFSDCCRVYRQLYDRDNGILPVTAVTALPLTADQSQRLRQKLAQVTGKTIRLENKVDAACLGGVRLEYDGKLIDDTLSHRLDNVAKLLKNTVI